MLLSRVEEESLSRLEDETVGARGIMALDENVCGRTLLDPSMLLPNRGDAVRKADWIMSLPLNFFVGDWEGEEAGDLKVRNSVGERTLEKGEGDEPDEVVGVARNARGEVAGEDVTDGIAE